MAPVEGKCHICQDLKKVKYCSVCDHWFCADCRNRFFWRGLEAIKVLVSGSEPGCCGPLENIV